VAIQLRSAFPGAAVLTSYGMTECMPITCPPPDYGLERAGQGLTFVHFSAQLKRTQSDRGAFSD
jgi:acyl-CoA synthetase (AMP-forming)/AMP-acid ligase II